MNIQSSKSLDIIFQNSLDKSRLAFWSNRLAELRGTLNSSTMTVSEFSNTCGDINNARVRVLALQRKLNN